jgi:hypothetical protein
MARKPQAARKKAVVTEVQVVEESEGRGGLGLDDGVVLTTTLALIAALVMIIMQLNKHYPV